MASSNQFTLFDDFGEGPKPSVIPKTHQLPVCDGGYFDALAAIGLAVLVDAYIDTGGVSPLIVWTPDGFVVSYKEVGHRQVPKLRDLKYSVAGAWRKGDKDSWKAAEGHTKKSPGWDNTPVINTDSAEVDVSQSPEIPITIGERTLKMLNPERQLYGVANKLGSPEWFNLCVYACRVRGLELLDGSFNESSITVNSMVLPQASKGAFASSSFSIENKSLPGTITTSLSRLTCLAVAGFIFAAKGQSPQKSVQGFAIPVPKHLRLETIKRIVKQNRERLSNGGFFFAYDNYLALLKSLLEYQEDEKPLGEDATLFSVAGASFIPLGNSSSPSGSWQLAIPKHRYTIESVERLQRLLISWKRAKQTGKDKTISIDRSAVAKLMRGFEYSDPKEATEGYLEYVFDVGLVTTSNNRIYFLTQNFFKEIMAHKYQPLLQELLEGDLKPFVNLVRQETYHAAFPPKGQAETQPNYQMIRSLREVQNSDDLIKAITEIAIERGITKIATVNSSKSKAERWLNPYEPALKRLIELAESDYSPKLLANLILSFALSKRPYEQVDGDDNAENLLDALQTEETND
ncbi:hypothetical protein GCM10023187_45670 [Nibrella viscosa]|uniref:CRISPR-associated protein Cst1 n=1 Tax=Nibrella viscosa TaxID=1084524 RepID=A0ABP8KTF2_9BACT